MSIPLISNITQSNDGEFWLVDSNAIYGGLYHVDNTSQMNNLPTARLKQGMLCYVKQDDVYYKYKNEQWIEWSLGINNDDVIDEQEKQELINIFKENNCSYLIHGHTHNAEPRYKFAFNASVERIDYTPIEFSKCLEGLTSFQQNFQ